MFIDLINWAAYCRERHVISMFYEIFIKNILISSLYRQAQHNFSFPRFYY
jgi:hypothetical protein